MKKLRLKHLKRFEGGLSDHEKLVSGIVKSGSIGRPPRKKKYKS